MALRSGATARTLAASIEMTQKLTPEQKASMRQSYDAMSHRRRKRASPAHSRQRRKYTIELASRQNDGQFLETRAFQVRDVARIYRIPPHMLGDLEKAGYASIEQLSLEFLVYCLTPWLTKWEQELTRKLLGATSGFFVKFDTRQLLRADHAAKQSYLSSARQWGIMTQNEGRSMEDLPPVEGGDTFLQPVNMLAVGPDGKPTMQPVPAPSGAAVTPQERMIDATAMRIVFEDAFARMLRKEQKALANCAQRNIADAQRGEVIEKFFDEHRRTMREALNPAARALCLMFGRGNADAIVERAAADVIQRRHRPDMDVAQVAAEEAEDFMESLIQACKQ
jgi:hypothetical protein